MIQWDRKAVGAVLMFEALLSNGIVSSGQTADTTDTAIPHISAQFDPDWQGTKFEPKEVVSSECSFRIFPYIVQGQSGRALILHVRTCGDDVIVVRDMRLVIDGHDSRLSSQMSHRGKNDFRLDNQRDVSLRELVPRIGSSRIARAIVETDRGALQHRFTRGDRRIFSRMWTLYQQNDLPQDEAGRTAWLEKPGPYFAGFSGVSEPKRVESSRHLPAHPNVSNESEVSHVTLQILVLKDGRVGEVRLLTSTNTSPQVVEAAVGEVKGWRFEPALRDNSAVDAYVTVTVDVP